MPPRRRGKSAAAPSSSTANAASSSSKQVSRAPRKKATAVKNTSGKPVTKQPVSNVKNNIKKPDTTMTPTSASETAPDPPKTKPMPPAEPTSSAVPNDPKKKHRVSSLVGEAEKKLNISSKKRTAPAAAPTMKPPEKIQKVASKGRKRTQIAPEYEDVWKEVYLAGTEWDQMKLVYDIDWDFEHLDDALNEGELEGQKVHLFGATEPQLVKRDEKDEKGDVVPIPVIIAVMSDVAPPSTVGLKSVQRTEEEIVPMSKLRMEWHGYAPPNVSHRRRFIPKVFVLKCNERHARLRNMQEAAVHLYDYVLPYFFNPEKVDDVTEDTVVQVLADIEGNPAPLMMEFDYELDELDEFVDEQIKENGLDAGKHSASLKKSIQDAVKATKLKYKADGEARQKQIDSISAEEKEAIRNMKLLKFYPQNEWPDVSGVKSKYVNRYYGQASKIV